MELLNTVLNIDDDALYVDAGTITVSSSVLVLSNHG